MTQTSQHTAGASIAPENSCSEEETSAQALPMVVWLQGDEPYFEDFSLDVDAAMERLQIKRSRLTQISGRELRVGKVRFHTYLKPVFRPQDVSEYQALTRASATKQRSAKLLQEANTVLREQTAESSQRIITELREYVSQDLLAEWQERTAFLTRKSYEALSLELAKLSTQNQLYQECLLRQHHEQLSHNFALQNHLARMISLQQKVFSFVQDLSLSLREGRASTVAMEQVLGTLVSQTETLGEQLKELPGFLTAQLTPLLKPPVAPRLPDCSARHPIHDRPQARPLKRFRRPSL